MKTDILDFFIIKDKKISNLLHKTLTFSFAICLLGILLMDLFFKYCISFDLFKISIIVFRTGLLIGISGIMSSFISNYYTA